MDTIKLAGEITLLLSPLIPYLHKAIVLGGKKAIEALGEKSGEYTWDVVKKLWSKLNKKMIKNKQFANAVSILAREPNNQDAQAELATAITASFTQDPTFATQIALLLETLPVAEQKTDVISSKRVNVAQKSIGNGKQIAKIKDSDDVTIRQTKG